MCGLFCVFSKLFCLIIWMIADEVLGYKRLGCYRDNWQEQRPLHHLLFTDRDESSPKYSGIKYTKETYDRRYLEYLVRRCESECKKFGYEVFGIEKFADCYSGDGGLKTYNRDGPTRQCFTSNYKPCDLTSCESEPCAGTENTIFVYELGESRNASSLSCFAPIKTTPKTTPKTNHTATNQPKPPTPTPTSKGTSQATKRVASTSLKTKGPSTPGLSPRPTRLPTTRKTLIPGKGAPTSKKPITKNTPSIRTTQRPSFTKATRPTAAMNASPQPTSAASKPTRPQKAKPTSSWLSSSKATIPVTKPTKATPGTTARSASPSSVTTRPTRPVATSRAKNSLSSSKATVPVTKLTQATPGTTVARSTSPSSVATRPTRPAATSRAKNSLSSSKATVPVTKSTKASRRGTTTKSASPSSVATRPTRPAATSRTTESLPRSKASIPVTKPTKATPGTTVRSASPSSIPTRQTRPTIFSQTTNSSPSSKGTIPITKLTTSANSGTTPGVTSIEIPWTYPTKGSLIRPQITCCVEQTLSSLVCAPECQTSCTAVCPPACCVAAPAQYPGVYLPPVLPLQLVYRNQCPSPCPSACAPRCSPKCCNAIIYQSPLFLKRKFIGRIRTKKKEGLPRKPRNLHQLKNAIKLIQNSVN